MRLFSSNSFKFLYVFFRYEYLNRRCITKEECTAIALPTATSGEFHQAPDKLKNYIVFNGTCTDSCPPGFFLNKAGTSCDPCQGKCQRWCTGMSIENIGGAQIFKGCTHIRGPLEISIKTGKSKVVAQELEENLGSIEEIESYLKIVRSFPIVNLNFLKNLTVIHGKNGDTGFGDNYSLLVLENQNLQELWDWDHKKKFKILRGKVFFHYNPKLCLQHIYKLLTEIHHDTNVSSLEVGKDSNGDKFPCNATDIDVSITFKSSNLIQINFPYLRINYDTTVLRYVVYFIKDKYKNITMFDEFDQCSDYNWRTKDVSVDPYDKHFVKNGVLVNLTDLEPNTQYAFYVTMYTVNRFGAKSSMYYETTLPTRPSELTRLEAISNKSSEIHLYWEPPKYTNGKMKEYIVTWSPLQNDIQLIRQRNYCEHPMLYTIETDMSRSEIPDKEELNSCCPNSKRSLHKLKDGFEKLCSIFDHCHLLSGILDKDISLSCESCFYSYVYDHPLSPIVNSTYFQSQNKTKLGLESWEKHSLSNERSRASTKSLPGNTTEFVIRKLLHFREYLVTVRACREIHPEELDKSIENRCSKMDMIIVKTQKDLEADKIPNYVNYEIVNRTVFISWDAPYNPNGLVVAFEVQYQHLDADNPITNCLPRSEYDYSNGRISIVGLSPGGYEVRVRAISLAGKGPFTEYVYFKINNGKFSIFDILFFVIILCIIVVFVAIGASIYKKRHRLDILVANVNPDYQYIQDQWEIPREDVELVNELGCGSFGKVYEGILKSSNTSCAVKTVGDNASDYETFVFLSEAAVMKSVSGAYHIVRLLGVVSTVRPPLVIMELMGLGDLKTYLRSTRETQPPSNATMINMAIQIGDGMAFMEAKKYVHRDLAARNCMVNGDCVVKVGDFGMTRDVYETDYYRKNSTELLPIRWMPPESLKDGVFTSHSDVWSFGVVLWEIVTLAEQPYQGSSNDQVLQDVIIGRRLEIPKNCSETLKSIMLSCWKKKPLQRMTFMQIVTSLEYYHDDVFKKVSFYHSQEAMDLRKSSSDYIEMRSVEDPLLGNTDSFSEASKIRSVSLLLSKVKSLGKGERLSRIEEAGPSSDDQI